ncbi:MAG: hypothetical protein KDI55_30515, partial [Anaerolineae bacterium]|nr:hypothetical protein [Anaerolineae bacterium]
FLVSPAVALPTGQNPVTLKFWNYQEIEDGGAGCYDGGLLEVSTNGGGSWTQVPDGDLLTDPYDGPIDSGFSNPRAGDLAWCGDPQPWLNSIVDVSAYAGQTVQFRWVMATDSSVSHPGWDVDDVLVQSCEVSGGDPNIDVNPLSLFSSQETNTTTNQPLIVANTGGGTLDW